MVVQLIENEAVVEQGGGLVEDLPGQAERMAGLEPA